MLLMLRSTWRACSAAGLRMKSAELTRARKARGIVGGE